MYVSWRTWIVVAITFPSASPRSALLRMEDWDEPTYLFADKFGRPAKGNDKGKVEGLVGYVRRNFMVPIPRVNSWDELNAHLEAECRKRRERRLRGHTETISEASSETALRYCRCPQLRTKPARRSPCELLRCLWFAIVATTTRCRPSTDTVRFW